MKRSLPDIDADFVIYKIRWLLNAEDWPNRTADWRGDLLKWVRSHTWIWLDFLQREKLTTSQLAESADELDADFQIVAGDLTDEGLEVFRDASDRFSAALSRRGPEEQLKYVADANCEVWERSLKRIRRPDYEVPIRIVGRNGIST